MGRTVRDGRNARTLTHSTSESAVTEEQLRHTADPRARYTPPGESRSHPDADVQPRAPAVRVCWWGGGDSSVFTLKSAAFAPVAGSIPALGLRSK